MVSFKKFHRPIFSEIQLYIFDLDQKLKHKTAIVQLFRKEFMLKTIIYLKSVGRKKEAIEFLVDTKHGPSVITDDCK